MDPSPAPRPVHMDGCGGCAECAAFEFQPENITPIYWNKSHFLKPQWKMPWSLYVAYRIVAAALIVAWITADYLDEAGKFYSDNYGFWMIFVTNWSFLILGISAVMHAVIVCVYFAKSNQASGETNSEENHGLDVPLMIFWIIHSCAFNGALVVTTSYWSFLVSVEQAGFLTTTMSHLKHTLNSVYVVMDLMITAIPIRVFHVVYPLFIGAIYTIFNVVYFTYNGLGPGGHAYAYAVMNWRTDPLESAFTCAMAFFSSIVMQGVLYGVYRLRLFIHGRLCCEHGELLACEQSGSENEVENILGATRNRAVSYSSTDNVELHMTSASAEPKQDDPAVITEAVTPPGPDSDRI